MCQTIFPSVHATLHNRATHCTNHCTVTMCELYFARSHVWYSHTPIFALKPPYGKQFEAAGDAAAARPGLDSVPEWSPVALGSARHGLQPGTHAMMESPIKTGQLNPCGRTDAEKCPICVTHLTCVNVCGPWVRWKWYPDGRLPVPGAATTTVNGPMCCVVVLFRIVSLRAALAKNRLCHRHWHIRNDGEADTTRHGVSASPFGCVFAIRHVWHDGRSNY